MNARRKTELDRTANDLLRKEALRRRLDIAKHPPKLKPVAHPFQGVGPKMTREDEDEASQ